MENVMSGMKPADALNSFTSAVQGIVGSGNYEMGH
jgi:hypothetical protein